MHKTETETPFEVLIRKVEHIYIYYTNILIIIVTKNYCVKMYLYIIKM